MGNRIDLDNLLRSILNSNNVYFQPPESIKMEFPCIVYKHNSYFTKSASNIKYLFKKSYQITYMDKLPNSDIPDKLSKLSMCKHINTYVANNLNYYVYNLYF